MIADLIVSVFNRSQPQVKRCVCACMEGRVKGEGTSMAMGGIEMVGRALGAKPGRW